MRVVKHLASIHFRAAIGKSGRWEKKGRREMGNAFLKKDPQDPEVSIGPRFLRGHRVTALGFLVEPGMHTTVRDSPLGIDCRVQMFISGP
jgi:hypothetical protein